MHERDRDNFRATDNFSESDRKQPSSDANNLDRYSAWRIARIMPLKEPHRWLSFWLLRYLTKIENIVNGLPLAAAACSL